MGYNDKTVFPLQCGPMDNGLGLLSPETTAIPIKADPRLKLLFELEPRYIVFLDNLADLLSPPKLPPLELTSPPGEFWPDVFQPTQMPWRSFQESVIWHLVAVVAIWSLAGKGWILHREPQVRNPLRDAQHITYYPPSRDYSARASRPVVRPHSKARPAAPHQKPLEVAREARRPGSLTVPPDLKTAIARPNLGAASPVPPSVPLGATARSTNLPTGLNSVVAPPPDVKGGIRAGGGLQASVVAPPPDASGISAGHSAISPNPAVIAPPPTLQTWVRKIESLFGDSGGKGAVVPPPPSVSGTDGGRAGSLGNGSPQVVAPPPSIDGVGGPGGGRSLTASASNIVPPPPSVQGLGRGRGNGFTEGGGAVVPPPPSLQAGSGTHGSIGSLAAGSGAIVPPPPGVQGVEGGRGSMLSAGSPSIVPPPPSMEARGGLGGSGVGGTRKSSLNGTGSDIVPPPPSMQGLGGGGNSQSASGAGAGGARNRNALGGLGGDIVPPPPSFDRGSGGGNGGGKGHTAGMPGTGSGIVPPPPSMQGVDGGGTGGRIKSLSAGGGSGVIPPPPSVSGAPGGTGRTPSGAGSGSGVVPPPPSISGDGQGGSGNGRLTAMNGAPGGGPVPPPPSTSGLGGGSGNGSGTSLSGPESAAPPAGGGGSGGNGGSGGGPAYSGSTGPLQQMDDIPDANIPPNPNEPPPGPAEEFPLRFITLPLPGQGSSFFSNYEVLMAERTLPRGRTQLIKLVYTFLPYQKRLSEYIQSNALVYTLRVTRDTRCDESLIGLMWSDANPDAADMFPGIDKNTKLPCYVTTADDYQRALVRRR
jgi:hypothetical protein